MTLTGILSLVEKQYLASVVQYRGNLPLESGVSFITNTGKLVWEVLIHLRAQGAEVTENHVFVEIQKRRGLVTLEQVEELFSLVVEESNYDYYAKQLRQECLVRKISDETLKKIEAVKDTSFSTFPREELERYAKSILTDLSELDGGLGGSKLLTGPEVRVYYGNLLTLRGASTTCVPSGDSQLDAFLYGGGLVGGTITIIYGPSGVGKSVFALNLVNKQINRDIPSLYVSLEMGLEPTLDRLVALRTGIPIGSLVTTYAGTEECQWERAEVKATVERELLRLKRNKNFAILENAKMSLEELDRLIDRRIQEVGTNRMVVTVDLLTMVRDFGGDNKASIYEDAMNRLHEIVRSRGVALIGVVQARRPQDRVSVRSIRDLHKFRPTIEQLKNSSALEERSRLVLGLFRGKHFGLRAIPEDEEIQAMDDIMEVSILKNNMGTLGRIKYLYQGEIARITRLEEGEENGALPEVYT